MSKVAKIKSVEPVLPVPPIPWRATRFRALQDSILAIVTGAPRVGESIDALHRRFAGAFAPGDVDATLDAMGANGKVWFMAVGPQVRVVAAAEAKGER